jgi:nucleotide-binding universal stress UspA family protein
MNIHRILITSELDELSAKVARFAVNLATQMNISEIVLLNIINPVHTQSFSASGDVLSADDHMTSRFNALKMKKNQELAAKEAEAYSTEKVSIKPIVRFGENKTDLANYMKQFDAGLLVCASRNENSALRMIFESNTDKIIRKADYPLIVLQSESKVGDIQHILVAIDIQQDNKDGLKNIAAFAKAVNARMQLLYVLTDDSQASDQAIKKLRALAIENMFENFDINVVNNNSLEDGIRSFARKHNPDMIAVLSQGKGTIHQLIFGSSSEDIIKESDKPVFVSKIN